MNKEIEITLPCKHKAILKYLSIGESNNIISINGVYQGEKINLNPICKKCGMPYNEKNLKQFIKK